MIEAFFDFEAQCPFREGKRFFPTKVIGKGNTNTAEFQNVAKAMRRDQCGSGAAPLQDRVCGNCRGMDDFLHVRTYVIGAERVLDAGNDSFRVILRGRRDLAFLQAAVRCQKDKVGKGSADIDADADARHLPFSHRRCRRLSVAALSIRHGGPETATP